MKILFPIDTNPFYDTSALGNRYESLIIGLLNNNVNVTIYVLGGYNSLKEFREKGFKKDYPKLKIKYIVFTFQNHLWIRRLNIYFLFFIFNYFINRRLEQAYQDDYNYLWISGSLTLRKHVLENLHKLPKKIKLFIELSEFQNIHKPHSKGLKSFSTRRMDEYTQVTMKLLPHVNCFAVMTKKLVDYYTRFAQNDARFIHLPMTVDFFRFDNLSQSNKWNKPYIAFAGTYSNSKDGVDILIRSFGLISNDFPDHKLLLAGFYDHDVVNQRKLILDLGLESRIEYLGVLSKEEVPIFLKNADLLVLCRPNSFQADGGFPTKLGEYLATGNPVCATTIGEIPNYLKDEESVFFAEPGSANSFADAMKKALSDLDKAKLIGEQGRIVAQKEFNKDIQAQKLFNFLNDFAT